MPDFSFSQDDIIIFCQAPADIPYVLSLYEKYQEEKKISIFVINVENVYKFINSLNLILKFLVFIPYKEMSFIKILDVLLERKRIKALKKEYFDSVSGTNVYFFSRFEDWLTSSFLKFLSKKNVIHYHDHYDFSSKLFVKQNLKVKLLILKFIYFIITDVVFKVNTIEKLPEFNYSRYGIKRESPVLNKKIFDKYGYKIDVQKTSNPVVLFFVVPCNQIIFDCKSHDTIQFEIIKVLRDNDWTVVVKGHPRLGISENILNVINAEIPSYIPAEFLKLSNISMCTGILTTALAHFALNTEIKTYSLINLFQFRDNNSFNSYKDYLLNLSQNKIILFQDYKDFENKIKYRNFI